MSGKHAERRFTRRRSVPIVVASAAVAVLAVTGVTAACRHSPDRVPQTISQPVVGATETAPGTGEEASASPATSGPGGSAAAQPQGRSASTRTSHPGQPAGKPADGTCRAGYYQPEQATASGEPFDPNAYTAAHRTLPFNTTVRVTNLSNGRSVLVRVNDRGPAVNSRCLDLTPAAFAAIASLDSGVTTVRYQVVS